MIAYASRTGTKRNLEVLRQYNWRLVLSPAGVLRTEGFAYGLDNGAWSSFQQGTSFDTSAFLAALKKFGANADWVVVPDIVAGGLASLDLSLSWLPIVAQETRRPLIAVQDGISIADIRELVGPEVGIFIGGSTTWKEDTMQQWGVLGEDRGAWVHCGRVNTIRRIRLCGLACCTSFDGSGASRYAVATHRLSVASRQLPLLREPYSTWRIKYDADDKMVDG